MLTNICLMRSRLPFSCRVKCISNDPFPFTIPHDVSRLDLDGILLHEPALKLRNVHGYYCARRMGISRNKWCRCHRRTSVLRSLLRQRLDLPVLPLNARISCPFIHTHPWAVVRPFAAVPHLAPALVSRGDHEHEHERRHGRVDTGIR